MKASMEFPAVTFGNEGAVYLGFPLLGIWFGTKGMGPQPQFGMNLVPWHPLRLPKFPKVLIIKLPISP